MHTYTTRMNRNLKRNKIIGTQKVFLGNNEIRLGVRIEQKRGSEIKRRVGRNEHTKGEVVTKSVNTMK